MPRQPAVPLEETLNPLGSREVLPLKGFKRSKKGPDMQHGGALIHGGGVGAADTAAKSSKCCAFIKSPL